MNEYHTIIAGAGPAGLACAALLAKSGRQVLVLERNSRVGPKVCAGGITWSGISGRVPAELIEKNFREQHISTVWQKTVISEENPLVSTINREALGKWMLDVALDAGAEIRASSPVTEISTNSLKCGPDSFRFQYLVGADGSASSVRRQLNIPVSDVGVGINYFVRGDFPTMQWHLDDRLFNNGYAWIFPHKAEASIGAYASRSSMSPALLKKNFHLWTEKHGINLGQSPVTSALINYDFRGWHFGNRFLVGDAAGLASALTGEGIYPAIVSGEEAARAIIDPDHSNLVMDRLLARHRLHKRISTITAGNRLACRLVMECLALALRARALPFKVLEMAG